MTIHPPPPQPFSCVICGAPQMTDPWSKWRGAANPIPPLCVRCEKDYGKAIGGWGDLNRDRRLIRQIYALATALDTTAYCKQNGYEVPYARA